MGLDEVRRKGGVRQLKDEENEDSEQTIVKLQPEDA